jgi:hypothetical protein
MSNPGKNTQKVKSFQDEKILNMDSQKPKRKHGQYENPEVDSDILEDEEWGAKT